MVGKSMIIIGAGLLLASRGFGKPIVDNKGVTSGFVENVDPTIPEKIIVNPSNALIGTTILAGSQVVVIVNGVRKNGVALGNVDIRSLSNTVQLRLEDGDINRFPVRNIISGNIKTR